MTAVYNLNSVALLCEFNASVWTARKLDRKKTDDLMTDSGAKAKGAARVNKNLLAGRPELEAINTLVGEIRNYVYDNTLPWSDNGQRFLITERFAKFDARIQDYIDSFNQKVAEFVLLYPTLITAQAMALGNMFNRDEFPSAADIASKFAISCEYYPVPSAGDIRVDVGNQAAEDLKARMEKISNARVDKMMRDVTERMVGHLTRMADRLQSDKDPVTGEEKPRRFTETLVSSAFELCDLIQDYNVTGDSDLSEARKSLESALSGVTVMSLRNDPGKRDDVQVAVKKILNRFSITV